MVFFCLLEKGTCRAGHTPNGWCNVKVVNLLSLERLKRSLVDGVTDLSLVHNFSIYMDGTVAKSLFNTTCLRTPIIPLGHSMLLSKLFNFNDITLYSVAILLLVVMALVSLNVERTEKRKNALATPVNPIEMDSHPRSFDSSKPLINETVEHEYGLTFTTNLSTVRVCKLCQVAKTILNCF